VNKMFFTAYLLMVRRRRRGVVGLDETLVLQAQRLIEKKWRKVQDAELEFMHLVAKPQVKVASSRLEFWRDTVIPHWNRLGKSKMIRDLWQRDG